MKAALYVRVSTAEQAEEGYSVEEQLHVLRKYCTDKGWEIVEVYEDAGYSGSSADRPAFGYLLEDIEKNKVEVVVVHAVDRFYRNLSGLLKALEHLNKHTVGFVSVSEDFDFTTPWGKLILAVLGSLAEIFLDKLSLEIAKGKRGRARSGLSNSRIAPFGYTRENGLDHIVEEEAKAVVTIFEEYATGEHTDGTIAELLDRMGFEPRNSDRWSRVTTQDMLQNPFFYGAVRYRDKLYQGRHEPIVSKELWDEVQRARAEKHGPCSTAQKQFYLLQRVVRCWHCKRRLHMYSDSKDGGTYYRDPAGLLDHNCVVKGRTIRTYEIDRAVENTIRQLKLPSNWRDRILAEANHQDQRKKIAERQKALRARLKRLKYLYIEGDIGTQLYEAQKRSVLEELESLQMPDDSTIIEAGQMLESLAGLWDDLTQPEKQEMLRSMLRAIYIDIEERRVVCYEPFAEFAPLFDQIEALTEAEGCYYREDSGDSEIEWPEMYVGLHIEVRQAGDKWVQAVVTRLSRSRVDYQIDGHGEIPYWTLMRWYGSTWRLATQEEPASPDKTGKEGV